MKIGDDIVIKFIIKDSEGTAIDITDGTIHFAIGSIYQDSYTSFTDPENGIHTETIPYTITADWIPGVYKAQVRYESDTVNTEDMTTIKIEWNLIKGEPIEINLGFPYSFPH